MGAVAVGGRARRLPRARVAPGPRHRPRARRARSHEVRAAQRLRRHGHARRRERRHDLRRVRRRRGRSRASPGSAAYLSVPAAALLVGVVVLRGSFHRIEHVLLLLSAVFVSYIAAGVLAHPSWGAAARGLVVPHMPLTRNALIVATGVVGTTLAPWGLAFIQSYAADKKLKRSDLTYERIDVVSGAVLTGIIGALRRDRVRRDALCDRQAQHQRREPGGARLEAARGPRRRHALRLRPRRRRPARRRDRAALDGVLRLGGVRPRVQARRPLLGGAVLLHHLLRDARRRRRRRRHSRRAARAGALHHPGRQRRPPPAAARRAASPRARRERARRPAQPHVSATRSRSAHSPSWRSRSSRSRSPRSSRLAA